MFTAWVRSFEEHAARRRAAGDPDWGRTARLDAALVRSIQRFQTGEDGDGASLLAKSARAGDLAYLAAVRLFVAEEQNHARLLRLLLGAAGAPTIDGHWSDRVFVWVRRSLGLRLELMTLMVAEVIALRYYEALRDGEADPLLTEVAGRILDDERRHVPFHCDRLWQGFAGVPRVLRPVPAAAWWVLLLGAAVVVALDHGPALRRLGVTRRAFVRDTSALFRPVLAAVLNTAPRVATDTLNPRRDVVEEIPKAEARITV
ncbi:hypothetical protein ABT297_31400 [Dactylosporangium sp. NPDC000555]|uniref:hypothetical protein n=1 Tax=Dactylosporangium sp. NPDC000555 TaxID=3154260 RepID=UPI0033233DA6